ncbi:unnamed protein product [Cylindrotheca closterium]|uniref:Uncharacterized protein n=1 Tax=Cylindrotheca closterium TaxID=2856 RepID=A0AAD2FF90_9STRA|nr:unnamed protein product [Cylindrotheca closterium]
MPKLKLYKTSVSSKTDKHLYTEEMTLDKPLKIPHANENKFGKSICFKLPNKVLHCPVYPLVRFDDSMEITISTDGKFIEKKLLKHIPKDASELLNGAVGQNDLLFASAEAKIRRMKIEMNEWEKVDADPLLQFGEEMEPFFVDRHGRHQDSYTLDTVEQAVSFCRPVHHHRFEDMQIELPTEATTTAATAAPGFVPQMSPEEWAAMQKVIKMFGQTTL